MTDLQNNSVLELWQSQPVEVTKMSIEELRRRAGKFERRIRWRILHPSPSNRVHGQDGEPEIG